jgi:hypothetical protein
MSDTQPGAPRVFPIQRTNSMYTGHLSILIIQSNFRCVSRAKVVFKIIIETLAAETTLK